MWRNELVRNCDIEQYLVDQVNDRLKISSKKVKTYSHKISMARYFRLFNQFSLGWFNWET
jgi:hypothetical protein